jgi:crotonobetainyl-CoA:carnitine CoA-transferase CaiB-like acyl-CoA transferase
VKMQNSFPRLSDTPGSIRSPAPAAIGQDNDRVYRELLGMDDAEMARLTEAGAI